MADTEHERVVTLGHLTVERLPPPMLIDHAAKAGFRALGIRFWDGFLQEEVYPMRPGSPMLVETQRRLVDSDLRVTEIETIILRPDVKPRSYLPILETGALLGAQRVVVGSIVADESLCTAMFAELCELAHPFKIAAGLEFYKKWFGCASLDQACRIVGNAAQPNGKMLVDALHLDRTGARPDQLSYLPARMFASFQICDAPRQHPVSMDELSLESRYARRLPGDGDLPLEDMLQAYPRTAPLGIEIPMRALEDSIGSQAFLNRCFEHTMVLLRRAGI